MKYPYSLTELHSHTTRSDGFLSPSDLVKQYAHIATEKGAGPPVVAITDHDVLYTQHELLTLKEKVQNRIRLIPGTEISCRYQSKTRKEVELHVLVYCYTDTSRLWEIAEKNRMRDRRPYIEAILAKLRSNCGIDLGPLDKLMAKHQMKHPGRSMLAVEMSNHGFVSNPTQAFDLFFGEHGEKRAYVPPKLEGLIDFDDLLDTLKQDPQVIPVLAHPFYNAELSDKDRRELVGAFRVRMGDRPAGMECLYRIYSPRQREQLCKLADSLSLLISAGNDFHGRNEEDIEIFSPESSSLFQHVFKSYPQYFK